VLGLDALSFACTAQAPTVEIPTLGGLGLLLLALLLATSAGALVRRRRA
jgi:hypothetical protein